LLDEMVPEGLVTMEKVRLVISCPNSIYTQKNYNSGGVVADETAKDARTAHVVLYHDAAHLSALEIPIIR
jgi:hypothetical protein